MKNFAQNLETLEKLTADIKRDDISLEDALKDFEQGIKLARGMEAEIDRIEGKIQILMNEPAPETDTTPELDLFSGADEATGTAGAPKEGTRQ
ncbi:MAG: exodeoxyribonuclease VII small subunit [Treponema sp.]|nr:exodeoxyribonuclease VII small subunit [Treponema sp.]